jgi:hypothetical protein
VSRGADPLTYYVSYLDPEAKTASITSVGAQLVISHDVPWDELTILDERFNPIPPSRGHQDF